MHRRDFMATMGILIAHSACGGTKIEDADMKDGEISKLDKPKPEWRRLLDREAYLVLFEEKTERPNSSRLLHEKRRGVYVCAACFLPLFESDAKFDSGTGWPSFFQSIPERLKTKRDFKLIFPRTEYHCIRCGGHQGHVFNDGPPPTGERYCNNGVALVFVPEGDELPSLRNCGWKEEAEP